MQNPLLAVHLLVMGALLASSARAQEPAPPASRPALPRLAWVTPAVRAPGLERRIFAAAGGRASCHVYTPEAYAQNPEQRFPVLYWLHGSGGGLAGLPWLAGHFGKAMREGKAPTMLVVFPNGLENGMWLDWKSGEAKVETLVVKDLIPYIDTHFRTIASRQGRAIEGFSMGGYGAARIGFKHHELFCAVSILGAGPLQPDFSITPRVRPAERARLFDTVFGGDLEFYRAQSPWMIAGEKAGALREGLQIRQAIGERDETLPFNLDFAARLGRLAIPFQFLVIPEVGHDPMALLEEMGPSQWNFYRRAFEDAVRTEAERRESRAQRMGSKEARQIAVIDQNLGGATG